MNTVPHRNELMGPTVEAIQTLGGSGTGQEIAEQVVVQLGIPDEVASQPYITKRGNQDHRTELEYELAWARTYLKQLGILENSTRGIWALTGNEFKTDLIPEPTEVEESSASIDWRLRIRTYLVEALSPPAFERLIQRVLRETGFTQVEVTGKSGDGGIDGTGIAKINGILSFRVVFQCKRYKGSVGASEVRDFRGAMQGRADKGLLITTGYFTRAALREATRDGALAIDLVDGERLAEKLAELSLGVRIETVEKYIVDEKWFESL